MERLVHIDIMKGFAIVLVVMGHLYIPYTDYLNETLNQMIYSFHMPLFIFLSGFVFHSAGDLSTIKKSVIKRCITLLIPYIGFLSLYCFIFRQSLLLRFLDDEMHAGYWFMLVLFLVILLTNIQHFIQLKVKRQGGGSFGCRNILSVYCDIVIHYKGRINSISN